MELKFCKFCGEKIDKNQIVCPKCGRQLETLKKNRKENIETATIEPESTDCMDYKNFVLIISLLLLPPLGIVYLWSSFPKIKNSLKIALTLFFGLTFFAIIYAVVNQIEEKQEFTSNPTYRYIASSTSKPTTTKATSTITTISTNSQSTTRQTERATTKASATTTQATKNESVSVSKMQAVKKAKSYLGAMSFSYKRLIEQLEYEGFSNEDAKYGAVNSGANWNTQAVKKAKSYLNATSFSYKGLVEQLEYEKFTSAQAKYGADNCDADWYKQAEKKAASYMKISSFSRKSLIEQLEYEGFTSDQAKHGADSVGL